MKIIYTILFVFLFPFGICIFAEHPDSTLVKINKNKMLINNASNIFEIDNKILSAIIFVERRENYSWEDDAMDEYLAQVGLNSSIGFCQVKLKTAYWIESQISDTSSLYFPGKKYNKLLKLGKEPQEIIDNLKIDSLDIMHAAAYLRIMISRWEKENHAINNRADILGTLYSTGLFYRNGKERKPNSNPKAN